MKRTLLTIVITLLATVGLTACGGSSEENAQSNSNESKDQSQQTETEDQGPVALVNGTELSRERFNTQYENMKKQYSQMGIDMKGKEEQLKKNIVNQMIGTELLTQKAKEADIKVSSEEVEKQYEQFKKRFKTEKQMKQAFEQNNTTEEKIKEQLKLQVKVDQYIQKNIEIPKVTEKELKEQYEAAKKQSKETKSFEEMKPQLKEQLTSQKRSQEVQKLVEKLRSEAEVEVKI